ncbi:MAG: hypothetical protein LBQ16_03460 [Gracilibacteraceae bacterium]|jgi:hypothetical protein|nr:hypothetical protein [Gracilibacteraceae bacterium]
MDTNSTNNQNSAGGANGAAVPAKGLTTKKIILILGALVIICATVVVTVLLLRDPGTTDIQASLVPAGAPVVDESNINEITGEIKEKVARGMFETHMNTTWSFPDGASASGDAVMGNAASNNYPFWFTITLSGTNEIVYTSSLLPVGTQLAEIVLDKDLAAGTYPAVLTVHMVDEEGAEVEGNMGFGIALIIEN